MDAAKPAVSVPAAVQFSLLTLLELTTICAMIFAASSFTGLAASGFLAVMAVFLVLRRGLLAIGMLAGAMIFASQGGVFGVIVLSCLLCLWITISRACHWR